MKWNCDLTHSLSVQIHRSNAAANERTRLNCPAQAHNADVIAILDLEFARELRRHFDEHLRLQFGKMAQKTRHPAAGMMFGQPICGENVRKARVARRCETVFISDRKSTRLNSSHRTISYAVFCLKKKSK